MWSTKGNSLFVSSSLLFFSKRAKIPVCTFSSTKTPSPKFSSSELLLESKNVSSSLNESSIFSKCFGPFVLSLSTLVLSLLLLDELVLAIVLPLRELITLLSGGLPTDTSESLDSDAKLLSSLLKS